jgi:glycosyltransferase involved in cell wall biosynthesis
MRVAVVNNCVPFITGGAEHLANALTEKLTEFGHEALLVKIPFRWHPAPKILEQILACRAMRLANVDRVIALKFPAYYVPHPEKILWLLHQFRQAYDLWGTEYQDIPATKEGERVREIITRSDNTFLPEARKIYTNSHVTADRLKKWNRMESEVLFPPLLDTTRFHCAEYGDYIFYPSRITRSKRQALVVDSMKHVTSGVRLVVAGYPETPADLANLETIIRENRLEEKVRLLPRFISEEEKVELMNHSLGSAYVPYDEDSYGYVTLETYHARKPVVTCTDSGGTSILVEDGMTGYAVPPEPRQIARAFDELFLDRARARHMGEAGYARVVSLGITWENVIAKLTQ